MKKLLMAASLSAAMVGSTAMAGGIQIDPTGGGNVGGSTFLTGLGNTTGDLILEDVVAPFNTGIMWGHNTISLDSTIGGELTFVFGNWVDSAPGFVPGSVDYVDAAGIGPAYGIDSFFHLYWDPDPLTAANHDTGGASYSDGIFLAAGTVDIIALPVGNLVQTTPGPVGPLSPFGGGASLIPTTGLSGQVTLEIEFIDAMINTDYVVNDLTTATVDLFVTETLSAPYIIEPASDVVGEEVLGDAIGEAVGLIPTLGGSILGAGAVGADGVNDMSCLVGIPGVGICSVQVQANSTLEFSAARIPEPTTLALLGAGLMGFVGFRGRRAK